jgi:hypothetical protein
MRVRPNLLLGGWIRAIQARYAVSRLSVHADANAQRAGDCILGNTFEEESEITDDAAMQLVTAC